MIICIMLEIRYLSNYINTCQPHGTPLSLIRRPVTIHRSGNGLVIRPRKLSPHLTSCRAAKYLTFFDYNPITTTLVVEGQIFRVDCLEMDVQIILYIS